MIQGKQTCKILKEIRKQVARANDIEYVVSECQYKGDCLGTCPKCEAEVRYLTQALEHRRLAGKVVSLMGISIGLMGVPTAAYTMGEEVAVEQDTVCLGVGEILVRGRVVDSVGNPLANAHIVEKGMTMGTCSNQDGYFSLGVSGVLPLRVSFIGYESKEVWVPRGGASNLRVVLSQGIFALDEVGVNGYFNSTKHSFIAGMMTTFAKGDNILVPQGWFRVEGCVEDENGEPLSGVVIYRKRKGKNFPECTTIDGGTFEFCLKRRRRLWFFKEGYQAQKMRIKKKNALGLRVVLKQEECNTGNGEAFL